MKLRMALWFLCLSVAPALLGAQEATVIHGVHLRGDATSHNAPIDLLKKDSTVTLIEPAPKDGFYHVKTADGKEGWVGVKFLNTGAAGDPPPATAAPGKMTPKPEKMPKTEKMDKMDKDKAEKAEKKDK